MIAWIKQYWIRVLVIAFLGFMFGGFIFTVPIMLVRKFMNRGTAVAAPGAGSTSVSPTVSQ